MLRSSITLLALALLPRSSSQTIANLPTCLRDCIRDINSHCADLDINCICRTSSTTSFLPRVARCYISSCDDDLDFSALLASLAPICQLDGQPIPATAISSANAIAAASGSGPSSGVSYTLIGSVPTASTALSTTTILQVDAGPKDHTQTYAVPEFYDSTTTIFGEPVLVSAMVATSTTTKTGRSTTGTSVIPVASLSSSIASLTASAVASIATVLPLTGSSAVSTTSAAAVSTMTASATSTGLETSLFSAAPKSMVARSLGLVVSAVLGMSFL